MTEQAFEGWAILELMGHRRLAGFVTEVEMAGSKVLRIDVHTDATFPRKVELTQFYGGGAIYCVTPTTEETARDVARGSQPVAPVARWQLNPPKDAVAMGSDEVLGDEPF